MRDNSMHRQAALAVLAVTLASASARPTVPPRCSGPEYHQFDFWKGDWDAYDMADTNRIVGRAQVTRMLEGCALREVYRQKDGLEGESYSLWDAKRGLWHQSWVTNRGDLLLLDGMFEENRMLLIARESQPGGGASLLRGMWWTEGTSVREKADRSTDGGKTWAPVFDMVFQPHGDR